jgi:glycogen debranching enzyme
MIQTSIFNKTLSSKCSNILLTNGIGSFFHFSPFPFSKYQGFFFNEDMNLFKTIDSIKTSSEKITKIVYKLHEFEVFYKGFSDKFFLPKGKNALIYETNSKFPIILTFDCRQADDTRFWGRYYNVYSEDNVIIVQYSKINDSREKTQEEYEVYTAIVSKNPEFSLVNSWEDVKYPFDAFRNDSYTRALYHALSIKSRRLAISSSTNKELAIKQAKEAFENIENLRSKAEEQAIFSEKIKTNNENVTLAYNFSLNALKSLKVKDKEYQGVYAGLPWFFHFWTRDSALSAKALLSADEKEFAKSLLLEFIFKINNDGLIPNRFPSSSLNSIDSTGLVFLRIFDFLKEFNAKEISQLKDKLKEALIRILTFHSADDIILSKPNESWMDTNLREGALIEVQCLQLSMYSLLKKLASLSKDNNVYDFAKQQENSLKNKVRSSFFKDGNLLDSLSSSTLRPNVFLAYYFYSELLSDKEWESVFDNSLKKLFLEWGGLSTIDFTNPRFTSLHTGMDNKSYHNGDSWFFLNNLAALCLNRLNKTKYKKYIDKIINASTEDILNKGIFGFHSELSSASHQDASGCLAQAWSSALYVEMIEEIYL